MKNKLPDEDIYALGLPEKALGVTVYHPEELREFLGFTEAKTLRDLETPGEFVMLSRDVKDVDEAASFLKNNRNELRKIFAPVEILTADNLGFWRILYNTKKSVQCLPPKKKTTSDPNGPHYSLESRKSRTIIRAKGRSFEETAGLFAEAVTNSVVEPPASLRPGDPNISEDRNEKILNFGAYALAPTLLQDPEFHVLYNRTYQRIEDWNVFVGKFNHNVGETRGRIDAVVAGILDMNDRNNELVPFDEDSLNQKEGLGELLLRVLQSDPGLYSRYEALLVSTGAEFLTKKSHMPALRGLLTK